MVAALLTALLCWACTDDTAESPDTRPVLTIAAAEDTWQSQTVTITRAGETLETLKDVGFGIFSTSLGLDNKKVQWKNDSWNYGNKLLWPGLTSVNTSTEFLAYAPYNYTGSAISLSDKKITFEPTTNNSIDLMWAKGSVSSTGTVTFNFHHALGRLSFGYITNNYGRDITLTKITFIGRRYTSGQLSLADGSWTNLQPDDLSSASDSENKYIKDLPIDISEGKSVLLSLPEIMQIPGDDARIKMKFTFTSTNYNEEVESEYIPFEAGINKTVNLTINMNHEVVVQ